MLQSHGKRVGLSDMIPYGFMLTGICLAITDMGSLDKGIHESLCDMVENRADEHLKDPAGKLVMQTENNCAGIGAAGGKLP